MNSPDPRRSEIYEPDSQKIYLIGGIAALLTVIIAFSEIIITFLPAGNTQVETIADWFIFFQNNRFMALRNLGLLNILMFSLGIPLYFALYMVHRKRNNTFALAAMIISFIGITVFLATNRALSMLDLSQRYALTFDENQKVILLAAGESMLSVGKSHSPGSFLGFIFGEMAGILMSIVMLKGKIFGKTTAITGIAGFTLLMIYEVLSVFFISIDQSFMIIAILGGIFNLIWLILSCKRFLQLSFYEHE
jgi:hypothetical protein